MVAKEKELLSYFAIKYEVPEDSKVVVKPTFVWPTPIGVPVAIYTKLSSLGSGTHTFKYPDISIEIDGEVSVGSTTSIPDYFKAAATVIVKGGLKNIFIKDGGVGYGVTNIINYQKQPATSFLTG